MISIFESDDKIEKCNCEIEVPTTLRVPARAHTCDLYKETSSPRI